MVSVLVYPLINISSQIHWIWIVLLIYILNLDIIYWMDVLVVVVEKMAVTVTVTAVQTVTVAVVQTVVTVVTAVVSFFHLIDILIRIVLLQQLLVYLLFIYNIIIFIQNFTFCIIRICISKTPL